MFLFGGGSKKSKKDKFEEDDLSNREFMIISHLPIEILFIY